MLANDPEHRLYIMDLGYNSIKKVGNPSLGLLNLSQLITQFDFYNKQNPQLLPFMFTVQMSFTREVQPELQFSLYDQKAQGNYQARFATPAAIDATVQALSNGEVDNLLKVEYDSASQGQQAQPQAVSPAPVQTPVATPVAPVVQQPVVQQPVVQQPVVQQAVAQPQATEELASL